VVDKHNACVFIHDPAVAAPNVCNLLLLGCGGMSYTHDDYSLATCTWQLPFV
jgi:hypothetical protein